MKKSITIIFAIVALSICIVLCTGQVEILEHPQTQHVLKGGSTYFHCKTRAASAFWLINGHPVQHEMQNYENQGFIFNRRFNNEYYNLTIIAPASEVTNNSVISCSASSRGDVHHALSIKAHLFVYTTFRPYQPSIDVQYCPLPVLEPYLHIRIVEQPLWPSYTIAAFEVNVTKFNDEEVVLLQDMIMLNDTYSYCFNYTLPHFIISDCSSIAIVASALSPAYGESEPSVMVLDIPRDPGAFSDQALNATVLFYPNGTPLLSLMVQLPSDICSSQQINYTIYVENEHNSVANISVAKPLTISYIGTGVVSHQIFGQFKVNQSYLLWVEVDSLAGNSVSRRYHFETTLKLNTLQCKGAVVTNEMASEMLNYKLAIAASLSFTILVFTLLIVTSICLLKCYRKWLSGNTRKSRSNVHIDNIMVPNPIYDGPVYESVHAQFESLTSTTLQAAGVSNSSACNNSQPSSPTTVSDNSVRYTDPPAQLPKIRRNSFATNTSIHPPAPDSDTENVPQSTSITIPAVKKSGKERNKLHLTLALTGKDSGMNTEPQSSQNHNPLPINREANHNVLTDNDEHYMVMSPAGVSINSAVKGGLFELSPEDIAQKYKE